MELLARIAGLIDAFSEQFGRAVAWLAVAMVVVQFAVVILRYAFGFSQIWLSESIIYMHAMLFMLAAGYALLHNAHVRVDILYREASPRFKAIVDIAGTVLLLWPVCFVIVDVSWSYVSMSWRFLEGSKETSGIPAVFLLKSVILVFAAVVALQGLSLAIHALRVLTGAEAPPEEEAPTL